MFKLKRKAKRPLLIFEGMDKSGKTTLINALGKKTGYKYITMDRGPVGYTVYNMLFNRALGDIQEYRKFEKSLSKVPHLVIYCRPDIPWHILNRLKAHNEELPDGTILEQHLDLYDAEFEMSILNKVRINTSKSIDDCVDEIIAYAEAVSKW